MRAVDPGELLEMIVDHLENLVLPAVDDQSARSMLWILIGLLDNLATRVVESPDLLAERAAPVRDVLAAVPPGLATAIDGAAVDDDGRGALLQVLRRLRALGHEGWGEAEEAWLRGCQDALSARTAAESARMRSTRYGRSLAGP